MHAYLQTFIETPVKFQNDQSETLRGVARTRYLLYFLYTFVVLEFGKVHVKNAKRVNNTVLDF